MNANADHPTDSDQNVGLGMPKTSKLPGLIGLIVLVMLAAIWVLMTSGYSSPKSRRIEQTNRLKQIGLAVRILATDHPEATLTNLNQLMPEYMPFKNLTDPVSGQPFVFVGQGSETNPQGIIAYGAPSKRGTRNVILGDGSVQVVTPERFAKALRFQPANTVNPPLINRNPSP